MKTLILALTGATMALGSSAAVAQQTRPTPPSGATPATPAVPAIPAAPVTAADSPSSTEAVPATAATPADGSADLLAPTISEKPATTKRKTVRAKKKPR